MKTNFLYVLLFSTLFLACKGKLDSPTETETERSTSATPQVEVVANTAKFLALSDVHIDGDRSSTNFGEVSGTQLWARTKAKIESVVSEDQPKFMVYLGDLPAYIDSTRATNAHLMLENLRNLDIEIPILYLPGNNDALGGDYHSFTNGAGNSVVTEDPSKTDSWPVLHKGSTVSSVTNIDFRKEYGYYSADILTGGKTLKVIALNTVIFSNDMTKNPATGKLHPTYDSKQNNQHQYVMGDNGVSQQEATQKQMTWFENKLDSLGTDDRVMIMMHIPIGEGEYAGTPMWNPALTFLDAAGKSHKLHNGFIDLLAAHQPKIIGLLNGHTHLDGLRRIYKTPKSDKASDMITFSVTTPGIAVNHHNNPGFKLFTYNTDTFDLLDFETHFASPTGKSAKGDFQFLKDSSYTFKQAYKVSATNETIFTSLSNQADSEIVQHMNTILGAKSNQGVKLKYTEAVNVYKN
jgi:sphingomyelin phosphodiesterase acid-like 3